MDLHRAMIPNPFHLSCWLTFACATKIKFSFVIWCSWKFSELNRLFGSLLDQFVSSFARADELASFEFDSDWIIDFSFFHCFFWRSGLLECWIRLYVLGHWYGCCSRTNAWQLSTYPRRRIPAFVPYGLSVLTQMEHFVCYSCEKRGFPLFFVSKRAVHTHMSKSKMCKGGESKRITVMTRPCDVLAGGSGGMRPCPPPQHQPPGIYLSYT